MGTFERAFLFFVSALPKFVDMESPVLSFTDHLGRLVRIPKVPQRIVSLCPSQTRTLFDLGLEKRMVGRTYFCIHPAEKVAEVLRVGGTKQVKMERIREVQPDLIIAEKEENTREMVEALEQEYPVYVTDVHDRSSALQMVRDLGLITGMAEQGNALAGQIDEALGNITPLTPGQSCLYFIWRKPWMVAGKGTFIDAMLDLCGLENAIGQARYPSLETADLQALDPDRILLSSEPYPFAEKHIQELQAYFPNAAFTLVDGEMFSWYGSQLLEAPAYLKQLLAPWR